MEAVTSFVGPAAPSDGAQLLEDADRGDLGYVMNLTRVWAHLPDVKASLMALLDDTVAAGDISFRHRGVLITACASTLGDSYCSLAWGTRLAKEAGPDIADAVLRGDDHLLDAQDRALARWARAVAHDPNATTPDDIASLRSAGFTDQQIVAITVFVALRLAFSTVNDALGTQPDAALRERANPRVLEAVTYGRPIA